MRGLGVIVACCALGAATTSAASAPTLAHCRAGQLRLTGSLQGATQSLLGTLTVANQSGRACALPVAPARVTLRTGSKILRTATVRMARAMEPLGLPARKVSAHDHVFVGVQWRNWCGSPRGRVRLSVGLTIYSAVVRTTRRRVRTPVCVDRKHASKVAVSRFKVTPP
jgi:hypothetical protein